MDRSTPTTRQKALALNLNARTYGTFAEIGGGQEVVRAFFAAGGAAGTVAKSISPYDMAGSGSPYSAAKSYARPRRPQRVPPPRVSQPLDPPGEKHRASNRLFSLAST